MLHAPVCSSCAAVGGLFCGTKAPDATVPLAARARGPDYELHLASEAAKRREATRIYRQWTAGTLDNVTHVGARAQLCYNFNRLEGGCVTDGCDAVHVCDHPGCAMVHAQHPRWRCPAAPAPTRATTAAVPAPPSTGPALSSHGASPMGAAPPSPHGHTPPQIAAGTTQPVPPACHVTVVLMTALHATARTHHAADLAVFFDSDLATVTVGGVGGACHAAATRAHRERDTRNRTPRCASRALRAFVWIYVVLVCACLLVYASVTVAVYVCM